MNRSQNRLRDTISKRFVIKITRNWRLKFLCSAVVLSTSRRVVRTTNLLVYLYSVQEKYIKFGFFHKPLSILYVAAGQLSSG